MNITRKPYKLVIHWDVGREEIIATGDNPVAVRDAETRVARNKACIAAIVLEDLTGPLETIWRNTWDE